MFTSEPLISVFVGLGWIPYKTEVLLDPNYWSMGLMKEVEHIHHCSAFSKPDLENLSFSVFDP
jgi:hypothetical protein